MANRVCGSLIPRLHLTTLPKSIEYQEAKQMLFGQHLLDSASVARPPFWTEISNLTQQIYRNRQNNHEREVKVE